MGTDNSFVSATTDERITTPSVNPVFGVFSVIAQQLDIFVLPLIPPAMIVDYSGCSTISFSFNDSTIVDGGSSDFLVSDFNAVIQAGFARICCR